MSQWDIISCAGALSSTGQGTQGAISVLLDDAADWPYVPSGFNDPGKDNYLPKQFIYGEIYLIGTMVFWIVIQNY